MTKTATGVLRAELRRRFPLAQSAAQAAMVRWQEAQAEFGRLDVLASELQRAATNVASRPEDLQPLMARSADVAAVE